MRNTFEILAGFLEHYECEVGGRALTDPPQEAQQRLRLLAGGALPKEELPEVMAELYRNLDWIAWLAREVKARREQQA